MPLRDAPIASADSIVLALRGLFNPVAAHGLQVSYELRLGEDHFRVEVANDRMEIARGEAPQAAGMIDTDPDTINAALWEGPALTEAQRREE